MCLVEAGLLLTGKMNGGLRNGAVLIEGDEIVAVGRQGELAIPPGAAVETVELPDMTIMPGMIDSHVHLAFDAGSDPVSHLKEDTDQRLILRMARHAQILLHSGVTTARDMGARGFLDVTLKEAVSGGVMTKGSSAAFCQYETEELRAAVDEAHRIGKRIAAHAHSTRAIWNWVEAGVDSISKIQV